MGKRIIASDSHYAGRQGWLSDNDLFSKVVINPKQWLSSAAEHIEAAHILLPSVLERNSLIAQAMEEKVSIKVRASTTSCFLFHCALAVENATKAVIADASPTPIQAHVRQTLRVPKQVLGHQLTDLARRAKRKIDLDEEYALEFLSRYGIWSGKYPTPIDNDNYAITTTLSDGEHYVVGGYNPDVIPSYLEFAVGWYEWAQQEANK